MRNWSTAERRILSALRTPARIQDFLDELAYDPRGGAVSPRAVMKGKKAQCYSGALFAAAALRELGFGARIVWFDAVNDDGHCIAIYERDGSWGAIAKSNFTTLRSREPVYSFEALGLSYFDGYYNVSGQRTMRGFTVPIDLEQFESRGWRWSGGSLLYVDRAIDTAERAWKLSRRAAKNVSDVSEQVRTAGLIGSNPAGLFRPD